MDRSRLWNFTRAASPPVVKSVYETTSLSTPARTRSWLEALSGQFYLAVLVACLVGALLSKKSAAGTGE
jgi:hypothetical protein